MTREQHALQLVERIYEAAAEPDAWATFADELSEAFGGAAVALSMRLTGSGPPSNLGIYKSGLLDEFGPVFVEQYLKGLPWGSFEDLDCSGRFAFASEIFPDERVRETEFYRAYMQPQGLAAECPVVHLIAVADDPLDFSGLAIYRRVGGRPFTGEDLALGNLLVPHFSRALSIHRELGGVMRERRALSEVIDRLPTGVVLIDARLRPVVTNRSAEKIAAQRDGLRLDRDSVRAADRSENTVLRKLIAGAVEAGAKHGLADSRVMAISRPSGKRPFVVGVTSLLEPGPDSASGGAVAVLFISDPDAVRVSTIEVLANLYSLTRAEAELVGLLAQGRSLEEVADARGVTMNTVRSQLKQVFSKTDTKRQGELVQLVLTGVATVQEE